MRPSSTLKFIESRYGLAPLGTCDASANDLTNAFNFNQPPSGGGPNRPATLPNTGGSNNLSVLLVAIALLIGVGGFIRRRARA